MASDPQARTEHPIRLCTLYSNVHGHPNPAHAEQHRHMGTQNTARFPRFTAFHKDRLSRETLGGYPRQPASGPATASHRGQGSSVTHRHTDTMYTAEREPGWAPGRERRGLWGGHAPAMHVTQAVSPSDMQCHTQEATTQGCTAVSAMWGDALGSQRDTCGRM